MLTYNPETDIACDVPVGRIISYEYLIQMRENALWACETWLPISKKMATRYYRIMRRVEQAMENY